MAARLFLPCNFNSLGNKYWILLLLKIDSGLFNLFNIWLIQFVVQIAKLQAKISTIVEKEPYMGEEVPLRWLKFEESVKHVVGRGIHYMNVEEVNVNLVW